MKTSRSTCWSKLEKVRRRGRDVLQGSRTFTDQDKGRKMVSLPLTLHPTMPLHPRRRGVCHHKWLLNLHLDPEETTPACRFGEGLVLLFV